MDITVRKRRGRPYVYDTCMWLGHFSIKAISFMFSHFVQWRSSFVWVDVPSFCCLFTCSFFSSCTVLFISHAGVQFIYVCVAAALFIVPRGASCEFTPQKKVCCKHARSSTPPSVLPSAAGHLLVLQRWQCVRHARDRKQLRICAHCILDKVV